MTEPHDGREPIERIEAALARLGAEHEPPAGWEARVLAAAAPPRKRPWWQLAVPGAGLLAAAALVIFLAIPKRPSALNLVIEIDKDPTVVRGETQVGSGDVHEASAHLGDVVHATAAGGGSHRAIWVYRDEHELVVACPGAARCRRAGDAVIADIPVTGIGTYQIVALGSTAALAAPTGNFDEDVAGALRANANVSQYRLTVR